VYKSALNSLGPRPELLNQWVTLELQAQRIPAARAVLGFMDTALQQHQQQQQPESSSSQLQREAQQQTDVVEQLQDKQQQQQQRSRRIRRQPKQASQVAKDDADALQGMPAGSSSSSSTPIGGAAAHMPGVEPPAGAAAAQHDETTSSSGSSSNSSRQPGRFFVCDAFLAPELQQQLDQLVNMLNSLGPTNRLPQQAAAAMGEAAAADGDSSRQQQQQQQQVRLPMYAIPPQGLQQHIPALASAAAMEHRAGNLPRALKLYDAALQLDPHNPRLLHSLAQLHMKRRDKAAVEEQLQALEKLQPGNGFLCYNRGMLAQQEGQLSLAREWYEKGTRAPGGTLLHCYKCCHTTTASYITVASHNFAQWSHHV
jgi:tetratricopeptide (TPR) repeat protein